MHREIWILTAVATLSGFMMRTVWSSVVIYATEVVGFMGSIASIVSTPTPWIGGYLYDGESPKLPFQLSFVLDTV